MKQRQSACLLVLNLACSLLVCCKAGATASVLQHSLLALTVLYVNPSVLALTTPKESQTRSQIVKY